MPRLDEYSIADTIAGLRRPEAWERMDVLLASLAKLAPRPAEWAKVDWSKDYPLAASHSGTEFKYHMRAALDADYVEHQEAGTPLLVRLTNKGWLRVSALRQTSVDSRCAFIALAFLDDMLALWEPVFVPALADAGYTAERSCDPEHNDRIDAEIIVAIMRSRFIVADVTFARTGVYFEAGYALGLGLPVIWTCRNDRMADMHFDTRQYNHILWTDAADLRKRLTARIIATI